MENPDESEINRLIEYAEKSDDELLKIVRNDNCEIDDRSHSLDALTYSKHPDVPALLLAGLSDENIDRKWRDVLVFLAEKATIIDESVRMQIAERLLAIALGLRSEVTALTAQSSGRSLGEQLEDVQRRLFDSSYEHNDKDVFCSAISLLISLKM